MASFRYFLRLARLEFQELVVEADELAVVAGFLAADVVHVAVFVAEFAEGEDGEGGVAGRLAVGGGRERGA